MIENRVKALLRTTDFSVLKFSICWVSMASSSSSSASWLALSCSWLGSRLRCNWWEMQTRSMRASGLNKNTVYYLWKSQRTQPRWGSMTSGIQNINVTERITYLVQSFVYYAFNATVNRKTKRRIIKKFGASFHSAIQSSLKRTGKRAFTHKSFSTLSSPFSDS